MSLMDQTENVKAQYVNDQNLSDRIKLHVKYSTNRQGLVPWLFEQYSFSENERILELGCGNGRQWDDRIEDLPRGCSLILSDLSEGMVDSVKRKFSKCGNVLCERMDIQDIKHQDETFDIVIANHMLYHVPDLAMALSEVWRVLKPGGKFYSATNGNGGLYAFLHSAFRRLDPNTEAFVHPFPFSLENGREMLSQYFSNVERLDFEDSFSITETQDLMDYIESSLSLFTYARQRPAGLYEYFEEIRKREGAIHIPKEVGLFISVK